jgi:hypothetical protein
MQAREEQRKANIKMIAEQVQREEYEKSRPMKNYTSQYKSNSVIVQGVKSEEQSSILRSERSGGRKKSEIPEPTFKPALCRKSIEIV